MDDYIQHSAKGTTWGKHKYIAIKNGRYIYPDDISDRPKPNPSGRTKIDTWDESDRYVTKSGNETKYGRTRDRKVIKSGPQYERSRDRKVVPGAVSVGERRGQLPDPSTYKKRLERQLRDEGRRETFKQSEKSRLYSPELSVNSASLARREIRKTKRDERQVKRAEKHDERETKRVERKVVKTLNKAAKTIAKSNGKSALKKYNQEQTKKKVNKTVSSIKQTPSKIKATVNKGKTAVSSFFSKFKRG